MEIWKKIPQCDIMSVSNYGRVRNDKTGKIYKFPTSGYCSIRVRDNNVQKKYYVHRLVAEAFIPNPNNYSIVNHKDENPNNNHVDNLEWCTQSYNIKYGTSIDRMMCNRDGKNKPRGVFVDNIYFRSLLSASKYMKCCHSTIRYKLNEGITEYNGFNIRWAS